jgi:DNA-binding transcriptional MocR family regulator
MKQVTTTGGNDDFLYQQLADRLEKQIRQQVLKTGDKLLSVRTLSREQGVSISTAFNAYGLLEIRGLIEARPKSGYYVCFTPRQHRGTLPVIQPVHDGHIASTDEMIAMVYKNLSARGVVRFSLATPSLALLPHAKLTKALMQVIRESPDSCMNYEEVQGNLRLRQQVARYAFNSGCNIAADDVVTTQGCMEALAFCLKAVTSPGDAVAIESPIYFGILNVMQGLGLKVVEIPADPVTGIDIAYLERNIQSLHIKACLVVTNFNNPSGSCMPDDHKQRLVALLAKQQIPLIEDDIYGELYFGKTRPRTCKSYDRDGWVLLCASVSKSLAPGYRVGWCIPGRFKEKILNLKLNHTVSSATPTQAAVGLFVETGRYDLHLRHLRKALYTQCLQYIQAITTYFPEDTRVSQPQGGYTLWIALNRRINAFELFKQAIAENISIAPGQLFSADARFTNFIRISFGNPFDKEIDRSLKVLGGIVKDMLR